MIASTQQEKIFVESVSYDTSNIADPMLLDDLQSSARSSPYEEPIAEDFNMHPIGDTHLAHPIASSASQLPALVAHPSPRGEPLHPSVYSGRVPLSNSLDSSISNHIAMNEPSYMPNQYHQSTTQFIWQACGAE